ncbi:uncharacterized protein LOC143177269 [Calliopsis andreniformis]|uniref:uncharacterized protein LOC143177269 n=1 Tax=Calliopsis andreniformis TaxID=337506 RepID=UPI003FCD1B02
MPTAIVTVFDRDQRLIEGRTLLDTCSNANFITENFAAKLRLPTKKLNVAIETLNELNTVTSKLVQATIKSRTSNYQRSLTFFVIPRISSQLPNVQINRTTIQIPANIKLADPNFHKPAAIDMLIGTGPTLTCLSIGQIHLNQHCDEVLVLQKTQLGWIIGGSVPAIQPRTTRKTFVTAVNFDLKQFWEIEEGPRQRHFSTEEQLCEKHFSTHVRRDLTGRYVVALPFNGNKENLGDSRSHALNRFLALERKFLRNPDLMQGYSAVIQEYIALGHMSQVDAPDAPEFYLPHHAVMKPTSSTTKIRVVFDGSAKTTSGISLNDTQLVGPTIQDDIFSLLLRFRIHAYVITGDIEKMYRQFIVRPEDRRYQRILWRNDRNEISTYQLNTVTFGLSSAPFLAIRCLHQLADDERNSCPKAASILKQDLYVDDLLTGASSYDEALGLRNEIIDLLQRGGLNIRQWVSNDPRLLSGLSEDQIHPKFFGEIDGIKTLGITWNARQDSINYSVNLPSSKKHTKRTVLSSIAKIFDPLGLLGPITITAKIFMQRLWQLKLDWDESLPTNLHTEWTTYEEELQRLNNVTFERHVAQRMGHRVELHGFCDASERAYSACFFVRSIDKRGHIKSSLLCAKSRVAPLKTVSLARLELCGATLLTSLYVSVREALNCNIDRVCLWTDSTIVLNWLQRPPGTLKTFVANRVAEIQTKTEVSIWRHIRSNDNPADLSSRGITASRFLTNKLWYCGPNWLTSVESDWPESVFESSSDVPESRKITCLATSTETSDQIFNRFSCIVKLRRIIAYCFRFRNRKTGPLTIDEIRNANDCIIRTVQASTFSSDIQNLKANTELHPKSKLLSLHPFLDDKGILRVGGRLRNSNLPFSQKHPILLPKNNHITELIIRRAHVQNYHAGITSTLYTVRLQYWPIDGKNITRKIVRHCVKCFRVNPPTVNYVMGNLPANRITEARPFHNCGVDYCGPFYMKEKRYRNRTRIKIYVAVFICFATKAIHLEVVSDLTTEAFLAALKRFIARRGICRNVYSDNGSNFIGAQNELTALHETLRDDKGMRRFLDEKEISWHFMPALSPHFGGLWEAAVKSFKHHLKRVVGEELFTYEQFITFVTEIEAILNSRPLTPLSSDPNDPVALTPGHFLIGASLTSLPEADFTSTPTNRLSNWQHIQKVKQDFWSRWYKEYINHLNVRHKWTKGSHEIKMGTIVVLKDDHLPPLQWNLGRIIEVHPGEDGIIRTVTVQTSTGIYRRNVKRLAPLPIHNVTSG